MKTIKLCYGKGELGHSHCVMAATSIVAEENFTDHPSCVCEVITDFLITLNDHCPNDEIRNKLLGHLPWLIIGTRGGDDSILRRVELFHSYYLKLKNNKVENLISNCIYNAVSAAYDYFYPKQEFFSEEFHTVDLYFKDMEYPKRKKPLKLYDIDCSKFEVAALDVLKFLEEEIIPVHTTMTIEPNYNIEKLCLVPGS